MQEQRLGIILKNNDDKIMPEFFKITIKNNKKEEIEKVLKEKFRRDLFKIVRKYNEKFIYDNEELTMYLVELVGYEPDKDAEYNFKNKEKLLESIACENYKGYINRNIIKRDIYGDTISPLIYFVLMEISIKIAMLVIPLVPQYANLMTIGILIAVYFIIFNIVDKFLIDILVKYELNIKIFKLISFIVFIPYMLHLIYRFLDK